MMTTSSSDTWTSGRTEASIRMVNASMRGRAHYHSQSLRFHRALHAQSLPKYSLGKLLMPERNHIWSDAMRGKQGAETLTPRWPQQSINRVSIMTQSRDKRSDVPGKCFFDARATVLDMVRRSIRPAVAV